MSTRRTETKTTEPTTPPSNLDAERSVLGAIIAHNELFDQIAGIIEPGDFFRKQHQHIFETVTQLHQRGAAIDFVTLTEALGPKLADIGGPAYISSLTDGIPKATNIQHYARIVYDHAVRRKLIAAGRRIEAAAFANEDPDAIIRMADQAILDAPNGHGFIRTVRLQDSSNELFSRIEFRHSHKGQITGVDTGFPSINELTLGWQRGDVNMVAARPSIGKTIFGLNTGIAAAKTGQQVLIISLEMRRQQLEDRMLAALSGVDAQRIRSGYLASADFAKISHAMEVMQGLPITINDRTQVTVWDIRNAVRRTRAMWGSLGLVVIDYVQLISGTGTKRGATRNEEMTEISRRLKGIADECNVPICLLSQLSRAGDKRADPRPKLSDLRESGALEQDADIVAFLHRKHHQQGGTTEFILEKQRNGPTGAVNLKLNRDLQLFTDEGEAKPDADAEPEPVRPRQRQFPKRAW